MFNAEKAIQICQLFWTSICSFQWDFALASNCCKEDQTAVKKISQQINAGRRNGSRNRNWVGWQAPARILVEEIGFLVDRTCEIRREGAAPRRQVAIADLAAAAMVEGQKAEDQSVSNPRCVCQSACWSTIWLAPARIWIWRMSWN